MEQSEPTSHEEKILSYWDELDRLMDQLRSMAVLLQCAQMSWTGNPMLTPYMQTMDDMLARVVQLHRTLHQGVPASGGVADGGDSSKSKVHSRKTDKGNGT